MILSVLLTSVVAVTASMAWEEWRRRRRSPLPALELQLGAVVGTINGEAYVVTWVRHDWVNGKYACEMQHVDDYQKQTAAERRPRASKEER